jgi:RHS repeat-associated protein
MTGENTAYSYDALNRLAGASNSLWSEAYGYGGFGNLTSKAGTGGSPTPAPAMSASYDSNNHQVGTSYDGNGNQLLADGNTNSYTVENRLNSQYAVAWPYAQGLNAHDPWGKRVMRQTDPDPYSYSTGSSPSLAFNFYGITGQRLATVTCVPTGGIPSCFFSGQNVYFGKKLLVSNGVNVVTDRLGSVRANLQGEGFAYYPYGEERTSTVDGRDKFGTYFRDMVGQDYADQRYYGSGTGRFWSADPYGGSGDASIPLSWNRYSYGNGDPVNHSDPSGLDGVCGPYATWMGEGCYSTGGSPPSSGEGGCWQLFGLEGCDTDTGGGGGCYGSGLGFAGQPDPGCPTGGGGDSGPAPAPAPSMYLKETSACVDPHGNQVTPYYALEVTYQLYINGAAAFSNTQMSSFGINYISETLTNATGNLVNQTPAKWCLGSVAAGVCVSGDIGSLNTNGTFTDILGGQGSLTQSFYINGTGAALNVVFTIPGFVGPQQPLTALNNTYNSRGKSISVAGGLLTPNGLGTCK